MTDNLTQLFAAQKALQENSFGYDFDTMTDEDRIEFIKWNVLALTDELHEMLGEIGWKPWASSRHINRSAFVGEGIDALHFMLNLFLAVQADDSEVMEQYKLKREKNIQRQKDGYDGVSTKCPNCGRALDDEVSCRLDGEHGWCGDRGDYFTVRDGFLTWGEHLPGRTHGKSPSGDTVSFDGPMHLEKGNGFPPGYLDALAREPKGFA